MVRKINRKSQIKTIVSGACLHSNYYGSYSISSIIKGYKYYIFLINEVIKRASIRLIVLKSKVRLFLVYKIKKILLKNRRIVVNVRLDNIKKYELVKNKL